MKNVLLFLFILIVIQSNAQNTWRYGVLASYELRGTSGDTSFGSLYPSESRFVPSYNFGLFIEKQISKKLILSFEPAYQRIGSSKYFEYYTYNSYRENQFTAIQMPVALKLKVGKKIYTEFGIAPVYILTGKEVTSASGSSKINIFEYNNLNQKYGSSRIQFPLLVGFGYNINNSVEVGIRGYIATEYYTYTGLDFFEPCPTCDPHFRGSKQNQGLALRVKYNFAK